MFTTIVTAIQGHTFAAIGYAVGLLCAIAVIVTLHDTRETVEKNTARIDRIEADSPCKNLSVQECAVVLFTALPDKQRHKFIRETIASDKYIHVHKQKLRERENNPPPPGSAIPKDSQGLPNPVEPSPTNPTPTAPNKPQLPNAPDLPSAPDPKPTNPKPLPLPDLPEAPELPTLPELPKLPQLPNLDLEVNP